MRTADTGCNITIRYSSVVIATKIAPESGGSESMDPRSVRSRAVVIKTTIDLMVERGMEAVSVEAIVARSGIAKTTVYRHWPTRESLILAAWKALVTADDETPAGEAGTSVSSVALAFGRGIGTLPMSVLIPDLLAQAERNETMREVYDDILRARGTPLANAVVAAVADGALPSDTDVDLVVSLVLGPIIFRQVIRRQPFDAAFTRRVVDIVMESTSRESAKSSMRAN